jgi:hypothetical protein
MIEDIWTTITSITYPVTNTITYPTTTVDHTIPIKFNSPYVDPITIDNSPLINIEWLYKPLKKKKMLKKSTADSLRKRKTSNRDRSWLQKLFLRQDPAKMPETVFKKLLAKRLIEVKLTEEGRKEGFIEAIKNV